jgi:acetyl-CoA C-acetyltransferase
MEEIVILSAARTAIGKFNGTLKDVPAPELGATAIKAAVERAGVRSEDIQECIMGNVLSAGIGQNPARQAAMKAGLRSDMGSMVVNDVCGSGLMSVIVGANAIKAGEREIVVAGGMESMNNAPYLLKRARFGYNIGDGMLVDHMVHDGLWDYFNQIHMGMTAEYIGERFHVNRADSDRMAYESHMKAQKATVSGKFKNEIVPFKLHTKKGDFDYQVDEGIRPDTSIEALSKLKSVFKEDGVATAGNASQLSDGAAALVVASASYAKENGLRPLARIVGYHTGGVDPKQIMEAPIPTTRELLKKLKLRIDDIDLFEHNEAFATASVVVRKELNVPEDRFNVNGGAVALGHPIGCSGARILTTLVHSMIDRNASTGLATLCLGGGNAISMVISR